MLNSIASREAFSASVRRKSNEDRGPILNDSFEYSSFAHGNNLNSMINSSRGSLANRNDKSALQNRNSSQSTSSSLPNENNVNYLVILIGVICLCILMLPLAGSQDANSSIPSYLYVSYEIKLFVSFILGMVTMVILKA